MRMSVLLPAPFSPSSVCTSPARTSKSTRSLATTPGNRFVMPRISSNGSASPAAQAVFPGVGASTVIGRSSTTILPLTIPATTFCAVAWIFVGGFAALLNWIFSPPFFREIRYETPPSFPPGRA